TTTLSSSCVPPLVSTPCLTESSDDAAFIFSRNGNCTLTGGNIVLTHATLYQKAGYLKMASASPPVWLGSTDGPFKGLAMWSELASNKFQINGGNTVCPSRPLLTPGAH